MLKKKVLIDLPSSSHKLLLSKKVKNVKGETSGELSESVSPLSLFLFQPNGLPLTRQQVWAQSAAS